MADLDSQRLQQQVDELQEKLNGLSKSVDQQGKASDKTATKTEALATAAGSASEALGAFLSQIYRGQQGAAVFTKAISSTTVGAQQLAGALGKNSKVAAAAGSLGVGLAELAGIAANMSDRLFESFQSLSRVGAAGADGMAGVFDQLQNFRLGLEDLGQLTQLFGQNAQSLVLFGGTVEEGAKSLGRLRKFVTGSGLEREFMGLGMNTQEINESLAGFAALQSRLGVRQVSDYGRVADSLNAYIAEQDAITKLTGAQRRQQEESAQKALAVEQFRAKINQLVAKGDEASIAEANRLMVSTDLSAAFAASASGFVTRGAGVTGQLVAQGKLQEIVNNRNIQMAQALPMIGTAVENFNRGVGDTLAATGRYQEAFGANYGQLSDAVPILKDFGTNLQSVEDIQRRQRERSEEGVKAQVDLRTAQMDAMQNLQSFVNLGVNPATKALAALATTAAAATNTLPGAVQAGTAGYGRGGTGTMQGSLASTAGGATMGAAMGAPLALPGIAIGGIVGGILGYLGYENFGGSAIKPEDVINFGSGTGSRQHFDKLQEHIKERAVAMAYAYQQQTGQKLNLNSAFRSEAEQAELRRRGGPNPIAEPGSSLHQQGRALDFNSAEVDALERMGLLQQFGFNRLRGDPPHVYMQDGGIAAGPQSGYQAILHGTEAVVPLPNGKTIPVSMPGMETAIDSLANQGTMSMPSEMRDEMSRQSGLINDQISRLDELISLMRNQNGISTKILQASTN